MIKFVCLFLLIIYQCCYGYPTKGISGELTDVTDIQNSTHVITGATSSTNHPNQSHNTFSSDESQGFSKLEIGNQSLWDIVIRLEDLINQTNGTNEMQGNAKKVVTKVKETFNKVKNKVKGGFDKVKNKIKVGIDKIKDKVGTGGGSGGGGYGFRDNNYRRPYKRPTSGSSGGGGFDLTFLWVFLGLSIVGVAGTVLYFMIKK